MLHERVPSTAEVCRRIALKVGRSMLFFCGRTIVVLALIARFTGAVDLLDLRRFAVSEVSD